MITEEQKNIFKNMSQDELNDALLFAGSDFETATFLINSYELKKHANMRTQETMLMTACGENFINIVKFLLTSPLLTKHVDIHFDNDVCFKYAMRYGNDDVLKYLIFDYKIGVTNEIEKMMQNNKDIHAYFLERMLMNQNKPSSPIIPKVKI